MTDAASYNDTIGAEIPFLANVLGYKRKQPSTDDTSNLSTTITLWSDALKVKRKTALGTE